MPTAWRIVKTRHAIDAFSGEGARLYGGRWNSPGVRMIYTSESIALATLEMLVHLETESLLASYSVCSVHIDESDVAELEKSQLPPSWREYPASAELRRIGDAWIASLSSAALQVPSAIIDAESNFLVNPLHPHFDKIAIGRPIPYRMDPRLGHR